MNTCEKKVTVSRDELMKDGEILGSWPGTHIAPLEGCSFLWNVFCCPCVNHGFDSSIIFFSG